MVSNESPNLPKKLHEGEQNKFKKGRRDNDIRAENSKIESGKTREKSMSRELVV